MRRLSLLIVAVLAAMGVAAPAQAAKRKPVKRQLTTFQSCDNLVAFAKRRERRFGSDVFDPRRPVAITPGLARTGRRLAEAQADASAPMPAAAAPAEGVDFSGTNVQEAGVDEPDSVKTDGRRMYVAMTDRLYAIDVTGDAPKLVATLPLEGYSHELLLRGGKLLVLSSGGFTGPVPTADSIVPMVPRAVLSEVDAESLKVIRTLAVPGSVVGGRMRGSIARIAIASPSGPQPEGTAPVRRWVPAMTVKRPASGLTVRRSVAPCTSVRRPQVFAGLGLLTLLTIDLDRGVQPVDSDAILADASTVYASPSRMYLATERWIDPQVLRADGAPIGRSTTVHGFDVSGDSTGYVGSGNVRGYLLNQFSLSEHGGALRVATTDDPPWLPDGTTEEESESFVTVLGESDGRLTQLGRVGGLGKGERIFAVRFVGDVGFVVTFRQTDPLYTLDLSDRTRPRVVGELKIPGYSAYLHPIGDDLMIGVGQDADDMGRTRGVQVSLFDVSDLRDPRRLHQRRLGSASSYTPVEHDHRAFLWWAPTRQLVLPLSDYGSGDAKAFQGAVGVRAERGAGFTETGRTEHPAVEEGYVPDVARSVVVNDRLYTISFAGIQAGRLDTLAGTAWLPFPAG